MMKNYRLPTVINYLMKKLKLLVNMEENSPQIPYKEIRLA